MGKYVLAVEKRAVKIGIKYLCSWYSKMRIAKMKTSTSILHGKSRSDWMKGTFLPISCGGILPFNKDEVIPDERDINSVDDLLPYIDCINQEPGLIDQWRHEAGQRVRTPRIIRDYQNAPSSEDVIDASLVIPDLLKSTRKTIDTSKLDFN
jgi:hypothetical protein